MEGRRGLANFKDRELPRCSLQFLKKAMQKNARVNPNRIELQMQRKNSMGCKESLSEGMHSAKKAGET